MRVIVEHDPIMKAVLAERQRCARVARAVLKRQRFPVQRKVAREIARRIEGKQ